jgi:hypothetical protein
MYGELINIILVRPQNLTNWLFHLTKLPTKNLNEVHCPR